MMTIWRSNQYTKSGGAFMGTHCSKKKLSIVLFRQKYIDLLRASVRIQTEFASNFRSRMNTIGLTRRTRQSGLFFVRATSRYIRFCCQEDHLDGDGSDQN